MEVKPLKKLKLYGFNNLTKSLSFNMYDICYAKTPEHHQAYIQYIDEEYNSERLTKILSEVAQIIGAKILNITKYDFDPQGSSVTMLISEGEGHLDQRPLESIVTHLDKSHITVHTYPESSPDQGISSFRADIDVSTCGHISPLTALNHLINSFAADIVIADYRVRGFTRDVSGKKFFIDHKINSIQNYIANDIRRRYQMIDVNVYQENLFHTKMILKDFDLDNYLFAGSQKDFTQQERNKINQRLRKEMNEIFYGRNIK